MLARVLHLIDHTTPGDALETLGYLRAGGGNVEHAVAALGHRSTAEMAGQAGIDRMLFLPSIGWADPIGWRAVRKTIAKVRPTHLHAWGAPAVIAASMAGFSGPRSATFADVSGDALAWILRALKRCNVGGGEAWTWVATSETVRRALESFGNKQRLRVIRPAVAAGGNGGAEKSAARNEVRAALGLEAANHPVIVLGGEGPKARHDLGVWTAAIVRQIFPETRVVVREDPRAAMRGHSDVAIERFYHSLQDEELFVVAPGDIPWRTLLSAADVLLVTASDTIPLGSVFAAMARRVPIVSTAVPALTEFLVHDQSALFSAEAYGGRPPSSLPVSEKTEKAPIKPRLLALQLERLLTTPGLGTQLAENAAAELAARFSPAAAVAEYATLFAAQEVSVGV